MTRLIVLDRQPIGVVSFFNSPLLRNVFSLLVWGYGVRGGRGGGARGGGGGGGGGGVVFVRMCVHVCVCVVCVRLRTCIMLSHSVTPI